MPDLVTEQRPVSKYTAFIGVDPGVSGGLAFLCGDSVESIATPRTEHQLWKWFDDAKYWHGGSIFACVELVGGWVGGHGRKQGDDGTQSNPGSAMFTFGQSYGSLRMALVAAGIPFEAVRPQAWQRALGIHREQGWTPTVWKRNLKEHAQQMFPSVKVTAKTADALLIAEFCRRKWGAA